MSPISVEIGGEVVLDDKTLNHCEERRFYVMGNEELLVRRIDESQEKDDDIYSVSSIERGVSGHNPDRRITISQDEIEALFMVGKIRIEARFNESY